MNKRKTIITRSKFRLERNVYACMYYTLYYKISMFLLLFLLFMCTLTGIKFTAKIHCKITGKNLARLHNLAHIVDFASVYEICVILNFKLNSQEMDFEIMRYIYTILFFFLFFFLFKIYYRNVYRSTILRKLN